MTFDQAQGIYRTHKTYETAYRYLAVASQRKAVKSQSGYVLQCSRRGSELAVCI